MASLLSKLRNEKKLSQADEAEIFSITPQAISKWESGQSIPDVDMLEKIAKFYDLPIDAILNGEIPSKGKVNETNEKAKEDEERRHLTAHLPIFIFSMSLFLAVFLFYLLPIGYFDLENGGESSWNLNFWDIINGSTGNFLVTPFAWIGLMTLLATCLLSIGNWLSDRHRFGFWIAEMVTMFVCFVSHFMVFGFCYVGPCLHIVISCLAAYVICFFAFPSNRRKNVHSIK